MKLLFDESLSPKLIALLSDLFPESEVHFSRGLRAQAISRFSNTRRGTDWFWSRPTAISNGSLVNSPELRSWSCAPVTIPHRSQLRFFGVTQFGSQN